MQYIKINNKMTFKNYNNCIGKINLSEALSKSILYMAPSRKIMLQKHSTETLKLQKETNQIYEKYIKLNHLFILFLFIFK